MRVKGVGENSFSERHIDGVAPSIVLIDPKLGHNIGGALRAASCYGMGQVWFTGNRAGIDFSEGARLPREERMKGYTSVSLISSDRPFDHLPSNAVPVAVEIDESAQQLPFFEHPDNAVYVFGPEDGSLNRQVLKHCHHKVMVPTAHCMNLASAVNVVCYDRLVKRQMSGKEMIRATRDYLQEDRISSLGFGDIYDAHGTWYGETEDV